MAVPLLDLRAQHARIKDDVLPAIMRVVEDQRFILGAPVEALEREVAALCHTRYAVGCASGTDALLLALRALDIGRGDEVVTTPFTFFATAGAIHNVGATPVFADIDPDTFNLSVERAAAAITPRTKAVIPVDLFGQMAPLEAFATAMPDMPLIEDAAQAIGAQRCVDGGMMMAGERATIGTLSFFPSKNLGGYGDGGMMVTQDEQLAARLMRLRTHGGTAQYHHDEVGYNSRLDAMQAAVLLAKLPHLPEWSAARVAHAAYYDAAFADMPEVRTPVIDPRNSSIFNQYTIRAERRDALQAHLRGADIGTAIYYPLPLHLQPCFRYLGVPAGSLPEAERASREVLSLPVYPELTTAQQDEVIAAVRGFYGHVA
ncbi:MAG TPA: DegT/DnrJ/EryC1/StrS family aminotransferase [Gemmatimonadaceae bacterium]|nr:DegT/DnrJ/EryC1/StrS family aminotransferase [Gemmatimonadaceae bacterium]